MEMGNTLDDCSHLKTWWRLFLSLKKYGIKIDWTESQDKRLEMRMDREIETQVEKPSGHAFYTQYPPVQLHHDMPWYRLQMKTVPYIGRYPTSIRTQEQESHPMRRRHGDFRWELWESEPHQASVFRTTWVQRNRWPGAHAQRKPRLEPIGLIWWD